jgi:large subunit ribosomal protein L35
MKLKTVKGVKGRIKITGTGKAIAFRPGRRHLLSHRRAKTMRHLRKPRTIAAVETRKLRALVPYA